ncbi:MAG TPA: CAP domain-containing protein [Polyangiaceae bacterium]|jgi:uncharacterized protein YkwD
MRSPHIAGLLVACALLGCGAAVGPGASNGAKMGEALAFAAIAGAAQVAQSVAEQHARNSAPIAHAGGVAVTPACDNAGQYGCLSVSGNPTAAQAPEAELSDDDARDYVLGYVNGVRKLNGIAPVARDQALDAFAQAGSDELAQDHEQNEHMTLHAQELHAASAEVQGAPDGASTGSLQDQLAASLLRWTGEGAGGMHHDTLLRAEWRKVGVGIVKSGGRMYFTVDFSG